MGEGSISCSWDSIDELSTSECMVLGGEGSPCLITVASQNAIGVVEIVSNARMCELTKDGSYVCTIKASDEGDERFKLHIDVQVSFTSGYACFVESYRSLQTL